MRLVTGSDGQVLPSDNHRTSGRAVGTIAATAGPTRRTAADCLASVTSGP